MKLRIFLRSFNLNQMTLAKIDLQAIFKKICCQIEGVIVLPHENKKFCVLKSPHIDKDSREQFKITLFKCFIDINIYSLSTIDLLLKMDLPVGVAYSLKILEK